MLTPERPGFLVVEVPDAVAARAAFAPLVDRIVASGGTCLAAALPHEVRVLEAGARLAAVLIARWDRSAAVQEFWAQAAVRDAFAPAARVTGARAIAVRGRAVPERANADDPASSATPPAAPAYQLIHGCIANPEPLRRYVEIVTPMLSACGAWYLVQARAPEVTVLHGVFAEQLLVVSRWSSADAAYASWVSDFYQRVALPTRTGHATLSVLLVPGRRD